MTTLELKVNLSDRLALQALADLLKDAMRRHVAQTLLAGAARVPQCPRRTP